MQKHLLHCKNRCVMRDASPHFYDKITLKFVISARKFVTLMWTENDASQMTYFSVSMTNLFFCVPPWQLWPSTLGAFCYTSFSRNIPLTSLIAFSFITAILCYGNNVGSSLTYSALTLHLQGGLNWQVCVIIIMTSSQISSIYGNSPLPRMPGTGACYWYDIYTIYVHYITPSSNHIHIVLSRRCMDYWIPGLNCTGIHRDDLIQEFNRKWLSVDTWWSKT